MNVSSDSSEASVSPFFEPGQLSGLEKMRFTTSRRVEGAYSGRHVAKRRGGGGEFVDYREYAPGDDLRRLDWKAMGRTGRSYLKLYQDETDLNCTVLLDCSGSMNQGAQIQSAQKSNSASPSKLQWAQYFATSLSHLIILGRDAVGLATGDVQLSGFMPPASSMRQRALLHETIAGLSATGQTDLPGLLDSVLAQSRRRGVLLVLSDFLVADREPVLANLRKFRAAGWEVITLHLVHPDEENLPDGNAFQFTGLESDGQIRCQISEVREAYKQRFALHLQQSRNELVTVGCDYHLARTSQSYLEVLRSFLVARSS